MWDSYGKKRWTYHPALQIVDVWCNKYWFIDIMRTFIFDLNCDSRTWIDTIIGWFSVRSLVFIVPKCHDKDVLFLQVLSFIILSFPLLKKKDKIVARASKFWCLATIKPLWFNNVDPYDRFKNQLENDKENGVSCCLCQWSWCNMFASKYISIQSHLI